MIVVHNRRLLSKTPVYWAILQQSRLYNLKPTRFLRREIVLERETVARYLDIEVQTMEFWAWRRNPDLKPIKRGRKVFYAQEVIERFIGRPIAPLMCRKTFALKIKKKARTIAEWGYKNKYGITPIYLTPRLVRYHSSDLEKFLMHRRRKLEESLRP